MACSHLVAINGTVTGLWPTAMQSGNISLLLSQVQWLPHLIKGLINGVHQKHRAANFEVSAQLYKVKLVLPVLQLGEVVTWQEVTGGYGSGWASITVEPNGVDRGGNGSTAVAPPLLFGLFVSEGLALCEPEDVVGFLAPVPTGSSLSS